MRTARVAGPSTRRYHNDDAVMAPHPLLYQLRQLCTQVRHVRRQLCLCSLSSRSACLRCGGCCGSGRELPLHTCRLCGIMSPSPIYARSRSGHRTRLTHRPWNPMRTPILHSCQIQGYQKSRTAQRWRCKRVTWVHRQTLSVIGCHA